MPYITQERRPLVRPTSPEGPWNPGELNFQITSLIIDYVEKRGISYVVLNDVEGVLGQVAKEFERRVVVPYENSKIAENGDVYAGLL